MPAWGNTDIHNQKPKWDVERETRELIQLTTGQNITTAANTIIFNYNDGGQNNLANVGLVVGAYAYAANLSANGTAGYFKSNNQVASISGNTVTFTGYTFGNIPTGTTVEFDKAIVYNANKTMSANYGADTVLVTTTRLQAANNNIGGNIQPGWMHVQKKVNNDGAVRYIRETLVALANPTATNTASGQTSWGTAFANT